MELPRNLLRAKMAKGPTRGLFVALPDSVCAEIVALSGADWAVIDAEHGPFELPTIPTISAGLGAVRYRTDRSTTGRVDRAHKAPVGHRRAVAADPDGRDR